MKRYVPGIQSLSDSFSCIICFRMMLSFIVYEHPYKLIVYDFHINLEKKISKTIFKFWKSSLQLYLKVRKKYYLSIMERLREELFMSLKDTCWISKVIELGNVISPDISPRIDAQILGTLHKYYRAHFEIFLRPCYVGKIYRFLKDCIPIRLILINKHSPQKLSYKITKWILKISWVER